MPLSAALPPKHVTVFTAYHISAAFELKELGTVINFAVSKPSVNSTLTNAGVGHGPCVGDR